MTDKKANSYARMLSDATDVVDAQIPDDPSIVDLFFFFRDRQVPVKCGPSIAEHEAEIALDSEIFTSWVERCEKKDGSKRIEIHSVLLQSLDDFGPRGVGFIKLLADSTLVDEKTNEIHVLPGACILKGKRATVLVGIHCDDGNVYTPIAERPSIPLGQVSALELPTGLIDDYNDGIIGKVFQELEDQFGIPVEVSSMTDLTSLASSGLSNGRSFNDTGVSCSFGLGNHEFVNVYYLEKQCNAQELEIMRSKCKGMVDDSDLTSLKIIPMEEVWQKSQDAKAIMAFFLLDRLRQQGKIPEQGKLATRINPISMSISGHNEETPSPTASELMVEMHDGTKMPQLAFDMYRIPPSEEGEAMVRAAVDAGYRHFDTAEHYRNEEMLGKTLRETNIPREEFFVVSKLWSDVQKLGRFAVRKSIEKSIARFGFGDYFDVVVVHWPVPRYYIDAYKELQVLKEEGIIKNIGVSNFNIPDYESLMSDPGVNINPAVNQFEVSPVMYRPTLVNYFQEKHCVICATNACKPNCIEMEHVINLAHHHSVTPAQIIHRWCLQKKLVVAAQTWEPHHMRENRAITHFSLSEDQVEILDKLTDQTMLRVRESRILMRKVSM